ncbi:MAG: sulfotransferase domain-containing protein [Deltaproteobacteria bacterium]|nr:sulfotransferase domain-containing protein [Deltaproteobacteria bacterium]
MKKMYIHIGLPKSASTFLQMTLFCKHPEVHYAGIYYDRPEGGLLTTAIASFEQIEFAKFLSNYDLQPVKDIPQDKKISLISQEGFVIGDKVVVAERLKQLFGDAKIIIILRNQPEIIESMYFQHLLGVPAKWPMCTFEEYLETLLSQYYRSYPGMRGKFKSHQNARGGWNHFSCFIDYCDIIKVYSQYFGRENIGTFFFEELRSAPEGFITKLCDFCTIDSDKGLFLVRSSPPIKPRMSSIDYYLKTHRGMNFAVRHVPGFRKSFLKKALREKPAGLSWSSEWLGMIKEAFGPSNIRLMEEYGVPLDKYNYIM